MRFDYGYHANILCIFFAEWDGMVVIEAQYRQMVQDKTGGLFRLAVGLMQVISRLPSCV